MKISVIGLGYVGSVAAAALAKSGHDVLAIDVDSEKVDTYRRGEVPIYEPGLSDVIITAIKDGNLRFHVANEVSESLGDIVMVATGTPTGEGGAADLSQVRSALEWTKARQPTGGVIVMKSTVPPGTGIRLGETILRGTSFQYVSNPEFLREGQAVDDWFNPERIVIGGSDREAIDSAKALYDGIEAPYVVTDVTSAEMIKYSANAFLATKISFINEIAALCDRLGATIDDVAEGISLDSRIGSSFLNAGVGYGGSCFPKDVRALDHLALTNDHNFELLRSVITVNNRQRHLPLYALRARFAKLDGLCVGVLGVAFKPNTDDTRESPAIDLIRALIDEGAIVRSCDPRATLDSHQALSSAARHFDDPYSCASGAQALVLMTEWPEIVNADWLEMARCTKPPRFLFDGRNALDSMKMRDYGFEYNGVGRSAARASQVRLLRDAV